MDVRKAYLQGRMEQRAATPATAIMLLRGRFMAMTGARRQVSERSERIPPRGVRGGQGGTGGGLAGWTSLDVYKLRIVK